MKPAEWAARLVLAVLLPGFDVLAKRIYAP